MCYGSREQSRGSRWEGVAPSPLSHTLWLQERLEAEALVKQRDMEQEKQPENKQHQGLDDSGGTSPEPPVPKGRARSTSQRHKLGSESPQQPQELRVRDEF